MTPHYFFALVLPDEIKQAIAEEMETKHHLFQKSVHPEDYHLTLAFLGSVSGEAIKGACEHVQQAVDTVSSFPLTITGFGTFGKETAPRIFWAGTDEPAALFLLQQKVSSACKRAGLKIDEKPFRPHVTTARKWLNAEKPFKQLQKTPVWPFFTAAEIALFQTNVKNEPKYEKKWSCTLTQPGEDKHNGPIS